MKRKLLPVFIVCLLISEKLIGNVPVTSEENGSETKTAQQELPFAGLNMNLSDQEKAAIMQAMQYGREISKRAEKINGLPYRRDAHAKATGCLRASFFVNGDISPQFQYSVFSEPGREYKAWIRFSNGDMTVRPDGKPDARGMAIKLLNVEGEKIAPELPGPATQDFIMTNTEAFFNRDIFDYVDDMRYLAKLERTRYFISLLPPRIHPRLLYRAVQTVSKKIDTPLQPQYYSMLPYQLGETQLKFSARPCAGMTFMEKIDKSDNDFLTETLAQQLNDGGACFDFLVQEKIAGKYMPLDNAAVIWQQTDSPFIPIARINIPPQSFTGEAQREFCENLSMNPWHGVGKWQPLGSLNKARRFVYYSVSQFRHDHNEAQIFEPTSWCVDGNSDCNLSPYLHKTKAKWPLPRCFDQQYQPVDGSDAQSDCTQEVSD